VEVIKIKIHLIALMLKTLQSHSLIVTQVTQSRMSELVVPNFRPSSDWKANWPEQKSQFYADVDTNYRTGSLDVISINLSILYENVFDNLKYANCTSITKYKLLLLS